MLHAIKTNYYKIPAKSRQFLWKALIFFICWKLLYNFVLMPINIPDAQLTYVVGKGTAAFLSLFYNSVEFINMNFVVVDGVRAIKITPSCNGLELIVLYLGFMLCMPINWGRFLLFALAGTAGVIILNILRCSGLAYMNLNHHSLTDFAHHYAFKIMVYAFVFYMWVLYAKKVKLYA